ncbi:hypothetical protein OAU17_01960 [Acidimicrobiia bacterium]|nr:hypothetical protein [Acidimicrobiia bacterium]
MVRVQNLKNLTTEKEGIILLKSKIDNFIVPTKDERRHIYEQLGIDFQKYSRSVDGIVLNVPSAFDVKTVDDCLLIEIKTTKAKNVKVLPYNVFFGFTKNEEDLFKTFNNYRLCIVHIGMKDYKFLNYQEYESLIQNKRVQYQINFKNSK